MTVDEVILRVPGWAAATPLRVTPLPGGITNQNYRVEAAGEPFVVRLGGPSTHLLGIDRVRECEAATVAARIGVGPEVVLALPEEGVLVTRFVDGRTLTEEDVRRPDVGDRVVAALRRVHGGPAIPGAFSPFRAAEAYRDVAVAHGVQGPPGLGDWLALARRIEAAIPPAAAVPCHNDLLPANFIDTGARVWILDWEYAAMGDPAFDLGNLAANAALGPEEERRLLERYAGDASPEPLGRLRLMRLGSDLREAMWGLVQTGISQLAFDFAGYARRHFARFAAGAAALGFRPSER